MKFRPLHDRVLIKVLDSEENKQLVGVVSVGDIASKCESSDTAKSIVDCCKHYH